MSQLSAGLPLSTGVLVLRFRVRQILKNKVVGSFIVYVQVKIDFGNCSFLNFIWLHFEYVKTNLIEFFLQLRANAILQ